MKTLCLFILATVLCQVRQSALAALISVPQDNWYYGGLTINGSFGAITVGPDGNIYAVTNGTAVSVFTANGTVIRQFGTNLNISGIAVDSETNIYVLDNTATNRIKKFGSTGNFLFEFGRAGTGETNINPTGGYSPIAIDPLDLIYVADSGNHRVQVFDKTGGQVRHWGGNDLFFFGNTFVALAALPNGNICIKDQNVLLIYSPEGTQLAIKGLDFAGRPPSLAVSPDGLIWTGRLSGTGNDSFGIYDVRAGENSGNLGMFGGPRGLNFSMAGVKAAAFDKLSTLYITTGTTNGGALVSMVRAYRQLDFPTDPPLNPTPIPVPYILSTVQRPGTALVDIDYRVLGGNTSAVSTAILGFATGGESLNSVIRLTSFAEQTQTNIGSNIRTEMIHRLTWDASEVASNFLNVEFEILAKDNRRLLPLRFVTIPGTQNEAALTMSSQPVHDNDCLSLWFWLIASGDSGVLLTNGTIKGMGGAYDGQTLAFGTTTTTQGRARLYERMNVRAPTPAEITRAQGGNYGFLTVDGNTVVKLP